LRRFINRDGTHPPAKHRERNEGSNFEPSRPRDESRLLGLLVNLSLVNGKLLAGIAGHSYALVAGAIESSTDIFSGMVTVHKSGVTVVQRA
jgi:hypothetical protein